MESVELRSYNQRKYSADKGVTRMSPSKETEANKDSQVEDDPISQVIGEFGPWQLRLTFLLSLFNFPCTWHIFATTFQAPATDFWCARPENVDMNVSQWQNLSHPTTTHADGTVQYDACRIWDVDYSHVTPGQIFNTTLTRKCDAWEFDKSEFGETIISEWGLVCDKKQLTNIAEMMFLAGVAIGGLICGMISDRFGRKRTLMCSLVLQISLATLIAFNPWYELYLVLRACLGFISVSVVFSGFVLCMELVGGKWRTISGVSYLFPVPLSYISIAGIAYFIRGWQRLQLAITLPSVLLFGLWWVLPESPRWLLTMGRKDEVKEILTAAAKVNKRTLPPNLDKFLQQGSADSSEQGGGRAGVVDLFRTPEMRKISLVLYVIWFGMYLVYYGLVLNLGNIGGDIYLNTILSGVVEIPAIAISILFLLKRGRRWPMCLTLSGAGLACLLTLLVPREKDLEWVTITLAMIGKFSVSSSNAIIPVFTAELFPTVIRNLGVGASNVSAGIALMLVPYLWELSSFSDRVPMAVLGVCGVIGGFSTLILEETADRPLIDTISATVTAPSSRPSSRRTSEIERPRKSVNSSGNCNSSFSEN